MKPGVPPGYPLTPHRFLLDPDEFVNATFVDDV